MKRAQASATSVGFEPALCIDGSRQTQCIAEVPPSGGAMDRAWLSVELEDTTSSTSTSHVDTIAVHFFPPWDFGLVRLDPVFEIWLGEHTNDDKVRCETAATNLTYASELGGWPLLARCPPLGQEDIAAPLRHVTLRQHDRSSPSQPLRLSEVVAYAKSATPRGMLLPPSPLQRGDVASLINERYHHGHPSNNLSDAGLVVHTFDGWEDEARPWELCHSACSVSTDHYSASVIRRHSPDLFSSTGLGGRVPAVSGFILSPTAEILCAYPRDYGTRTYVNGHCTGPLGAAWDPSTYTGNSLLEAMDAQIAFGAYYNEVVIGSMYHDDNLPWAIEAFFYVEDAGAAATNTTTVESMRHIQRAFLERYGLTAAEVPLLRYERSCFSRPMWMVDVSEHVAVAACFVDVS